MFTTPDDINRCKKILQRYLKAKNISLDNDAQDEIVQKVLQITYATGGAYTNESLKEYLETYLEDNPI